MSMTIYLTSTLLLYMLLTAILLVLTTTAAIETLSHDLSEGDSSKHTVEEGSNFVNFERELFGQWQQATKAREIFVKALKNNRSQIKNIKNNEKTTAEEETMTNDGDKEDSNELAATHHDSNTNHINPNLISSIAAEHFNFELLSTTNNRYKRQRLLMAASHSEHKEDMNLPMEFMSELSRFQSNFHATPLGSFATSKNTHLNNTFVQSAPSTSEFSSAAYVNTQCGGILKARHGIIKTPNFPHRFQTPIECVWIIDASDLLTSSTITLNGSNSSNITIVVYLTQLYALGGLKFTEYMYYSDDYKVPAHRVFTLTEDDVTQVAWMQFSSHYLEIRYTMTSLDGTHLRALDRLLDVYGFNITYEVQNHVKSYQCNALQCRFLGHCYAKADFSSYYCACFPGFSDIDCGRGPLCDDPHTNICQNGATCKHIGDAAITCHCPIGYRGRKCEIPEIHNMTIGCIANSSESNCNRECDFNKEIGRKSFIKSSKILARSGKTRYEVTIRLGTNLTSYYHQADPMERAGDHLPSLLERHITRVLRNFNITKISDLELISNSTVGLDITFHFFGIKNDSIRIREAITRMVERGRIGNITLVSNYHHFEENPPLNLLDMRINQKSTIREDDEFIISCTAQGSPRMQFQWFKDGAIVNASRATRVIWTTVLPPEGKDVFTAILGVTKAIYMDEGIYTCKVTDWDIEQCRSLHVHVKSPPRLRVDPASVTLHRGDSLRIRCTSSSNDDIKRYGQLGYSWTRNGVLFQSDPETVMWEDLYPDGSILKINNIQKSAEYTCIVSNTVKPVSKSVYITVIDQNMVHVCHTESAYGVRWPTSAPGAAIRSDCPRGFEGHSHRICEKHYAGNSSWLLPDFSKCINDQLLQIYNQFRAFSAGFQKSNSSSVLEACLKYVINRYRIFLPGEASFLIDMLHEIDSYLQLKGTQLEREMAAEIILLILDKVLQNTQSLNSQQKIQKLQLLTQSAALNRETIAASQLSTSTLTASATSSSSSLSASEIASSSSSSESVTQVMQEPPRTAIQNESRLQHSVSRLLKTDDKISDSGGILTVNEDTLSLDRLNSLHIYMTSVKTLPFNLRIYGDNLYLDQLYMEIGYSIQLHNIMANSTIFASVIAYKNLKSFLPKTYYTKGSDPKGTDFILASRIIQTWIFQSNRSNDNFREPLDLPIKAGHAEIIFQHESTPKNGEWKAVCGYDYRISMEYTWRSDLCITKNLMENITRCICPLSGAYVVMLMKRNSKESWLNTPQSPIFIIISCACCLLLSCSSFIVLLPIWFNRKCAITFLKMQFCISTSSVMVIFLLGFLKMLPSNWHAIISSTLASLLLLGISTLIAIALVLHSELILRKTFHTTKAGSALTVLHKQDNIEIRCNSTTNISSSTSSTRNSNSISNITYLPTSKSNTTVEVNLSSGICGAIGISWLLPLLFAITSPLICSIIDRKPQNWWLDIMTKPIIATSKIVDMNTSTESANDSIESGEDTTRSTQTMWSEFSTVSADIDSYTDTTGYSTISLNFVIFVCVDVLFILLFLALFSTVLKKFLWLWRRNCNIQTQQLDKLNLAIERRIGILYRIGFLLIIKLSTDTFFIIYVNHTQNSLLCYSFGVSCILLGFVIAFCFVIKTEYNTGTTGSRKRITFKQRLSDNCYTGTINSTLNFRTNHKSEKDDECMAPEGTTNLRPHPKGSKRNHSKPVIETFISTTGLGMMSTPLLVNCLQNVPHFKSTSFMPPATTRCCNVLADSDNNKNEQSQMLPPVNSNHSEISAYFDAFEETLPLNVMNNLECQMQLQENSETIHKYVGVETLDILQGVGGAVLADMSSMTEIRTINTHATSNQCLVQPHPKALMAVALSPHVIDSLQVSTSNITPTTQNNSNYACDSSNINRTSTGGITTTSVTTQTPKTQKRVTIIEPTTHTFDPLLPTIMAASVGINTTAQQQQTIFGTPVITIARPSSNFETTKELLSSDNIVDPAADTVTAGNSSNTSDNDEHAIHGMFDRITHDLDYLLNRTNKIPPPQRLIINGPQENISSTSLQPTPTPGSNPPTEAIINPFSSAKCMTDPQ